MKRDNAHTSKRGDSNRGEGEDVGVIVKITKHRERN